MKDVHAKEATTMSELDIPITCGSIHVRRAFISNTAFIRAPRISRTDLSTTLKVFKTAYGIF